MQIAHAAVAALLSPHVTASLMTYTGTLSGLYSCDVGCKVQHVQVCPCCLPSEMLRCALDYHALPTSSQLTTYVKRAKKSSSSTFFSACSTGRSAVCRVHSSMLTECLFV